MVVKMNFQAQHSRAKKHTTQAAEGLARRRWCLADVEAMSEAGPANALELKFAPALNVALDKLELI